MPDPKPKFRVGDLVQDKNNPGRSFTITEVMPRTSLLNFKIDETAAYWVYDDGIPHSNGGRYWREDTLIMDPFYAAMQKILQKERQSANRRRGGRTVNARRKAKLNNSNVLIGDNV